MNKILTLTCLLILPSYSYSADQLPTIKVQGKVVDKIDPQHLTTRIQWIKFPQINYETAELKNQDRSAIIRLQTDTEGKVVNVDIQESTGIRTLDQKLVNAIEQARVKPFKKDGKAIPIIGFQTFTLNINSAQDHVQSPLCTYRFNSLNWKKQENGNSVPFYYVQQPQLALDESLLKFKDRIVKFKFKVNKQGHVTQAKLTKLSGVNAIDQQVIQTVENAKIDVKRSYRTLWTYKPSNFSDEIHFKVNDCH